MEVVAFGFLFAVGMAVVQIVMFAVFGLIGYFGYMAAADKKGGE